MPFEIIRNDITNMEVDAVVNTANPKPLIGYGVDSGIHKKAGPKLLEARQQIGRIAVGKAAITPAFDLKVKYVIHAVGPVWQDGAHCEEKLLAECYDDALRLAAEASCESVAFPLLSAGNHGFPKELALRIALNSFGKFLMKHDMQIYLVVFSRDAVALSEKLVRSVTSYIDDNYTEDKKLEEYGVTDKRQVADLQTWETRLQMQCYKSLREEYLADEHETMLAQSATPVTNVTPDGATDEPLELTPGIRNLQDLFGDVDDTFSEALIRIIDRKEMTDPEVYKRANIDRKLFNKIKNTPEYQPKKATALAFAIALELNLDETKDLIGRAGYALTHASKLDIIVEYFIVNKIYDMMELNAVLFEFEQPTIGV